MSTLVDFSTQRVKIWYRYMPLFNICWKAG